MENKVQTATGAGITQHSLNVYMLDDAFYMPQLSRSRRIWLYLPQDYFTAGKSYPVLYMHDGQNLFDETTAFDKEWEIDETLNKLHGDCIVAGIDNSEHRIREYNYNDHERHGKGEGRKYMEFIVHTLKPYIDAHFRTKKDRLHTHLAGSSMGGLISLYGAVHFAETFGGAGVFSPSLWAALPVKKDLAEVLRKNMHLPQRFFLYGGEKESRYLIEHLQALARLLQKFPQTAVRLDIEPEGMHNEYYWGRKFEDYYRWLMGKEGA